MQWVMEEITALSICQQDKTTIITMRSISIWQGKQLTMAKQTMTATINRQGEGEESARQPSIEAEEQLLLEMDQRV